MGAREYDNGPARGRGPGGSGGLPAGSGEVQTVCLAFENLLADAPLGEDLRLLLYDAARELLLNAAVHGRATKAIVELRRAASHDLCLTVADNGSGFDTERLEDIPSRSFGLFALREKAQLMGGSLEIAGGPAVGTRVTLTLPRCRNPKADGTAPDLAF